MELNKRKLEQLLLQLLKTNKEAAKSAGQLADEIGIEQLKRYTKNENVSDQQVKKQAQRRIQRVLDELAELQPAQVLVRYEQLPRTYYRQPANDYGSLLQALFGVNPSLKMHLSPEAQESASRLQNKTSRQQGLISNQWQRKIYVGRSGVCYRAQIDNDVIAEVYHAVDAEKFIEFDYLTSTGKAKHIEVFPWGILLKGENCYLVANAYNSQRELPITYAMHRIKNPRITTRSTFAAEGMPKDENHFQRFCQERQLDLFANEDSAEIVLQLRFYNGKGRTLQDTKLSTDQKIEVLSDSECRLTATVKDCFELHRFILGNGDDVEVEAPTELRMLIADKLKNAQNRYS
jgi:predicted DNA-binding transcriptional regulator YafY